MVGRGGYRHDSNDHDLLSHFPCWMRAYRMHKYTKLLQHLTYRQMKQLSFDQLEQQGIDGLGPRNKLIKLLSDVDVDDLEKCLTPESNTPPSQRQSRAAAAAAPVLVASGRSTSERGQDGSSALEFDTIVTPRTNPAPSNATPAPPKLTGALQPVPMAVVEAATVYEDSTAGPSLVQTQSAAQSLHPQENSANSGRSSAGPSNLGPNTASSFQLKPTAAEFKPLANSLLHNEVVLRNNFGLPKPQVRRFWNRWFWQQGPRHLLPPPNTSPEAFLPMDYPVPRTSRLAPSVGQQGTSSSHREETLDSVTGNQGHVGTMEEVVDFEEDARSPGLPEGMRELAASLIRMVDDLTAGDN